MDSKTKLSDLKQLVETFCAQRDWDQFHSPKDLAIGVSTEASELLELFRFKSDKEITAKLGDPLFRERVSHELADVLFFTLRFAQKNAIDLSEALEAKIKVNAQKYPVETARGSNKKYNE